MSNKAKTPTKPSGAETGGAKNSAKSSYGGGDSYIRFISITAASNFLDDSLKLKLNKSELERKISLTERVS